MRSKKATESVSAARSAQMALIRGSDTKPELKVRRMFHAAGLRYRLHDRRLPGTPDIVFPSRRVVVFVHGCFWHRHRSQRCKLARLPKSRLEFWRPKLEGNAARDRKTQAQLRRIGWRVFILWECEIAKNSRIISLIDKIQRLPARSAPSSRQ